MESEKQVTIRFNNFEENITNNIFNRLNFGELIYFAMTSKNNYALVQSYIFNQVAQQLILTKIFSNSSPQSIWFFERNNDYKKYFFNSEKYAASPKLTQQQVTQFNQKIKKLINLDADKAIANQHPNIVKEITLFPYGIMFNCAISKGNISSYQHYFLLKQKEILVKIFEQLKIPFYDINNGKRLYADNCMLIITPLSLTLIHYLGFSHNDLATALQQSAELESNTTAIVWKETILQARSAEEVKNILSSSKTNGYSFRKLITSPGFIFDSTSQKEIQFQTIQDSSKKGSLENMMLAMVRCDQTTEEKSSKKVTIKMSENEGVFLYFSDPADAHYFFHALKNKEYSPVLENYVSIQNGYLSGFRVKITHQTFVKFMDEICQFSRERMIAVYETSLKPVTDIQAMKEAEQALSKEDFNHFLNNKLNMLLTYYKQSFEFLAGTPIEKDMKKHMEKCLEVLITLQGYADGIISKTIPLPLEAVTNIQLMGEGVNFIYQKVCNPQPAETTMNQHTLFAPTKNTANPPSGSFLKNWFGGK